MSLTPIYRNILNFIRSLTPIYRNIVNSVVRSLTSAVRSLTSDYRKTLSSVRKNPRKAVAASLATAAILGTVGATVSAMPWAHGSAGVAQTAQHRSEALSSAGVDSAYGKTTGATAQKSQASQSGHAAATSANPSADGHTHKAKVTDVHAPKGAATGSQQPKAHQPAANHKAPHHKAPHHKGAPAKHADAKKAPAKKARKPYLIYDSVTPSSIPAGKTAAVYANGSYATNAGQVKGHKSVLWIDVKGNNPSAHVLDVEPGDATPASAAQWVKMRLSKHPHSVAIVYTMRAQWGAVKGHVSHLPKWMHSHVRYWIADPTGQPHMVPGASATQWYWGKNYDITTANPNLQQP